MGSCVVHSEGLEFRSEIELYSSTAKMAYNGIYACNNGCHSGMDSMQCFHTCT